jgi:alpha-glucosidase
VFAPYLRNHRQQYAAAGEPWAYGEEAEAISKAYIGFRYALMPYLYSAFFEATQTGMPVSRSLAIDHAFDANVYRPEHQHQSLFGPALLVDPMTSQERQAATYLPAGTWYDIFTDRPHEGGRVVSADYAGHRLPIFAKASAIIPMQGPVQSTRDDPGPVLRVHVFNGTQPNAFTLYEDDGETLDYREGRFRRRTIAFDPQAGRIAFSRPDGRFESPFRRIRLILHGFSDVREATVNGEASRPQSQVVRMLDPLAALADVYYDPAYLDGLRQLEPMEPQRVLEFDDAERVVVHLR